MTAPDAAEPATVRYHLSRYADEQLGDRLSAAVVLIHNAIVTMVFGGDEDEQPGKEFQGGVPLDFDNPSTDIYCFHGKLAEDGTYDVFILREYMANCGEVPDDAIQKELRGKTIMLPMPVDVENNFEFRLIKPENIDYLEPIDPATGMRVEGAA